MTRFVSLLALALAGCTVGPNYHQPGVPAAPRFKEAAGWTPSQPADALIGVAVASYFPDLTLSGAYGTSGEPRFPVHRRRQPVVGGGGTDRHLARFRGAAGAGARRADRL